MATINPFSAVHYSRKNQKNIGRLVVSDLDTAEHLWGTSDSTLSFRNILVGSIEQRSQIWQAWLSSGELEYNDEPSFFVLNQQFNGVDGEVKNRWAVYGSSDLAAGKIKVHENVLAEGVERARQATECCEGDIAPIFVSLDDKEGAALRPTLQKFCADAPVLGQYRDAGGMEIRFWKIQKPQQIAAIQKVIGDGNLYLLDGHHRLAAAKANLQAGLGDGKILVCVCSMGADDLNVLPIHRLVYCERWMLPEVLVEDLVQKGCKLETITDKSPQNLESVLAKLQNEKKPSAVMLHAHSDKMVLLRFGKNSSLPEILAELSVARLDLEILKDLRGSVIPTPDLALAMEQLAQDQVQVAFFLPGVSRDQVRRAAGAGVILPRKSTRFVPKPPIGLICRPWGL
jgi:uncharacterized protein (DUF1015 family)